MGKKLKKNKHIEFHNAMAELSDEYKVSLSLLKQRIKELTSLREKIKLYCLDQGEDPAKDPEIIDLGERLKPLISMKNELQEISKEVSYYYVPGHWRDEKYTMNQRKVKVYRFAPLICDLGN